MLITLYEDKQIPIYYKKIFIEVSAMFLVLKKRVKIQSLTSTIFHFYLISGELAMIQKIFVLRLEAHIN